MRLTWVPAFRRDCDRRKPDAGVAATLVREEHALLDLVQGAPGG